MGCIDTAMRARRVPVKLQQHNMTVMEHAVDRQKPPDLQLQHHQQGQPLTNYHIQSTPGNAQHM
jgi:hypothetical protein